MNALFCRLIATQTHGHVRPKQSRTPGARAQGTAGPPRPVEAFCRWIGNPLYLFWVARGRLPRGNGRCTPSDSEVLPIGPRSFGVRSNQGRVSVSDNHEPCGRTGCGWDCVYGSLSKASFTAATVTVRIWVLPSREIDKTSDMLIGLLQALTQQPLLASFPVLQQTIACSTSFANCTASRKRRGGQEGTQSPIQIDEQQKAFNESESSKYSTLFECLQIILRDIKNCF